MPESSASDADRASTGTRLTGPGADAPAGPGLARVCPAVGGVPGPDGATSASSEPADSCSLPAPASPQLDSPPPCGSWSPPSDPRGWSATDPSPARRSSELPEREDEAASAPGDADSAICRGGSALGRPSLGGTWSGGGDTPRAGATAGILSEAVSLESPGGNGESGPRESRSVTWATSSSKGAGRERLHSTARIDWRTRSLLALENRDRSKSAANSSSAPLRAVTPCVAGRGGTSATGRSGVSRGRANGLSGVAGEAQPELARRGDRKPLAQTLSLVDV